MPFIYEIDADLGLLYYFAFGNCAASQMFAIEQIAAQDARRQPEMAIIIDLFAAEVDLSLPDLYQAIALNKRRNAAGQPLEATAVITRSGRMNLLGDVFALMGDSLPIRLGIFNTLPDAAGWLGLADELERITEIQTKLRNSA